MNITEAEYKHIIKTRLSFIRDKFDTLVTHTVDNGTFPTTLKHLIQIRNHINAEIKGIEELLNPIKVINLEEKDED